MFVQIHTLHSYPASLLNRDDTGQSKTIPFGGYTRTRISSQSLKRHWRESDLFKEFEQDTEFKNSIRSRIFFDQLIYQELIKNVDETTRQKIEDTCKFVADKLFSTKKELQTSQVIVLGRPEIDAIKSEIKKFIDTNPEIIATAESAETTEDHSKKTKTPKTKSTTKSPLDNLYQNIKDTITAIQGASCGLDAALFGRMVTSDFFSRKDSCVHVAHAFTVHAQQSESDYFSVIDDLLALNGDLGAGHVNSTELTTGLFYNYIVIDLNLLYNNLFGCDYSADKDPEKANKLNTLIKLVQVFAEAVCTVTTGAKLGSTAPYTYASFGMFEVGKSQPRSCANAFLNPTSLKGDLLKNAVQQLDQYIAQVDKIYPKKSERSSFSMTAKSETLGNDISFADLNDWLKDKITPLYR
jgi:CRISPR system Cascade subunit CasC